MGKLFTPFISGRSKLRAHMEISEEDMERFDELPEGSNSKTLRVLDEISSEYYTVRRASCGAACFCAAEITDPIKY